MRYAILFYFSFLACSAPKQESKAKILGEWLYVTAESLGDYSQNDKKSIEEFDKTMTGKKINFFPDSIYNATRIIDKHELILQTGRYVIASDGKSMMLGNKDPIKISLTDSIFKFYSPNNAVFVWRKIK